jgi:hypothetical protein
MAELQYLDNVHNSQPTVTVMDQGDYLVSPSGVYNAVLNSNGAFLISYGSQPNTLPSTWSVNPNAGAPSGTWVAPFTIQNVPQWTNRQYYIFGTWGGGGGTPNGTHTVLTVTPSPARTRGTSNNVTGTTEGHEKDFAEIPV